MGEIMLTIEQRRKTDRKRRERWRQKKLAEGCKQVQLMITPEAQAILEHEKFRTGEPYVQIIHRAIFGLEKGLPITPPKNMTSPEITETDNMKTRCLETTKPLSKSPDDKKANQQDQLKLF